MIQLTENAFCEIGRTTDGDRIVAMGPQLVMTRGDRNFLSGPFKDQDEAILIGRFILMTDYPEVIHDWSDLFSDRVGAIIAVASSNLTERKTDEQSV